MGEADVIVSRRNAACASGSARTCSAAEVIAAEVRDSDGGMNDRRQRIGSRQRDVLQRYPGDFGAAKANQWGATGSSGSSASPPAARSPGRPVSRTCRRCSRARHAARPDRARDRCAGAGARFQDDVARRITWRNPSIRYASASPACAARGADRRRERPGRARSPGEHVRVPLVPRSPWYSFSAAGSIGAFFGRYWHRSGITLLLRCRAGRGRRRPRAQPRPHRSTSFIDGWRRRAPWRDISRGSAGRPRRLPEALEAWRRRGGFRAACRVGSARGRAARRPAFRGARSRRKTTLRWSSDHRACSGT